MLQSTCDHHQAYSTNPQKHGIVCIYTYYIVILLTERNISFRKFGESGNCESHLQFAFYVAVSFVCIQLRCKLPKTLATLHTFGPEKG
jgi:hypothetical protein